MYWHACSSCVSRVVVLSIAFYFFCQVLVWRGFFEGGTILVQQLGIYKSSGYSSSIIAMQVRHFQYQVPVIPDETLTPVLNVVERLWIPGILV